MPNAVLKIAQGDLPSTTDYDDEHDCKSFWENLDDSLVNPNSHNKRLASAYDECTACFKRLATLIVQLHNCWQKMVAPQVGSYLLDPPGQ